MLMQLADDGLLQIHSAADNTYPSKTSGKESTNKINNCIANGTCKCYKHIQRVRFYSL